MKKLERLVFRVGEAVVTMTNVDLKDPVVMKLLIDNGVWEEGDGILPPGIPLRRVFHVSSMRAPEPTEESGFNAEDRELLRVLRLSLRDPECALSDYTPQALGNRYDSIQYVWDLVRRAEDEVHQTQRFGKKSIDDVQRNILNRFNLSYGMDISRFEPYIEGY